MAQKEISVARGMNRHAALAAGAMHNHEFIEGKSSGPQGTESGSTFDLDRRCPLRNFPADSQPLVGFRTDQPIAG